MSRGGAGCCGAAAARATAVAAHKLITPNKTKQNKQNNKDVEPGQLRLLDVDERLVLPTNSLVRVLVTSADVIHSWAVPSLGIKIDAVPGRLNQVREWRGGRRVGGGGGLTLGRGEAINPRRVAAHTTSRRRRRR